MSKNAKKPTLNDILDLAIELARRHADASPELAAALREYDADLQCAWKKTAPMLPAKEEAAVRPRRRRGRPNRVASGAPLAEQANRNASWLVAFMMREWRVKHGRERVRRDVMEKMVRAAVAEAAQAFGVSASQIDVESVYWNARKTGRFVVRR